MRIMRELYTSSMEMLEEPQAGTVNATPTLYDQRAVGEEGTKFTVATISVDIQSSFPPTDMMIDRMDP